MLMNDLETIAQRLLAAWIHFHEDMTDPSERIAFGLYAAKAEKIRSWIDA